MADKFSGTRTKKKQRLTGKKQEEEDGKTIKLSKGASDKDA